MDWPLHWPSTMDGSHARQFAMVRIGRGASRGVSSARRDDRAANDAPNAVSPSGYTGVTSYRERILRVVAQGHGAQTVTRRTSNRKGTFTDAASASIARAPDWDP